MNKTLTEIHSDISSNTSSAQKNEADSEILCCGCDGPLMFIEVESKTVCYICRETPSTYVCAPCSSGLINFFDRKCAEIPRQIDYPYHHHLLRLRLRRNAYCAACLRPSDLFNFGCDKCKFIVDVNCALRETMATQEK